MALIFGINGGLGIGDESGGSYGTAVSPTNWIREASSAIDPGLVKAFAETLQRNGGPVTPPRTVQAAPSFTSEFEGSFDFEGILFEALTGVAASTTGAGPYTHSWEPSGTAGQPAKFYTLEQILGDSGNSRLIRGACLNTLGWTFQPGTLSRISTSWIAQRVNAPASASTPTYEAVPLPRVYWDQITSVTWNGITLTSDEVMGINLQFNNNLQRRFPANGTIYGALPHYGGIMRDLSVTIDLHYGTTIADALAAGADADTQSDLVINLAGPGNYAGTITARNAFIPDSSNAIVPISASDVLPYSVDFMARADETDVPWALELVNDSASSIANT